MQGWGEGASGEEVRRRDNIHSCGQEQSSAMLNMLVKAVDDMGQREHHRFLQAPLEAPHPQGVGVLMKQPKFSVLDNDENIQR